MNLKPSELICFSLKKQLNEIMSNVTKQEYKIQLMEIHGKTPTASNTSTSTLLYIHNIHNKHNINNKHNMHNKK